MKKLYLNRIRQFALLVIILTVYIPLFAQNVTVARVDSPVSSIGSSMSLLSSSKINATASIGVLYGGAKTVATETSASETLATFDFESSGGYTTDITEFNSSLNDYYHRLNYTTNSSTIHTKAAYTNQQGDYIFCAEDVGLSSATATMTFDAITITGKTTLKVAALVAGQYNEAGDYETNKHISFYANIDGGGATLIGAFRGRSGTGDIPFYLYRDDNLNGSIEASETTVLTSELTEFTFDITGTGSSMVLTIETKVTTTYEEVAYDNIRVTAASVPTVSTQAVSPISTTTATGNGNITATGGASITERGIYYSTTDGFADGAGTKVSTTGDWNSTGAFSQAITSLSPNTRYYVKAFATNSEGASYGSQVSFATDAAASTTYTGTGNWSNPSNWSNGIPGTTTDVTVASGTLTVNSDVECTDFSISSGAVVSVDPGNTLTVSGTLTNGAGISGLVLQSDASATGMLMNNTTGVLATIKQYLVKDQWHYMGIPTTYLADANDSYHNCYLAWIHESNSQTGSSAGWEYLAEGDALGAMHGYAVQYNRTDSNNDTTITFTGTLNAGIVDSVFVSAVQGWNFISNPYPVTIDWSKADTVFSSVDYSYPINMRNMNYAIYLYNPALGSYGAWVNGSSTNGQTQYIPPMQGFFIQVYNISASISFTDECKVNQQVAFKSASIKPQIRLAVTDNDIGYDEMLINVNSETTLGFDGYYDASKMKAINSKQPLLYSVLNEKEYSINSIPEINEDLIIPLKVMVKTTGEHKLILSELKAYNYAFPIVLFDENKNFVADLENQDYVFDGQKDEVRTFYLGFKSALTSAPDVVSSSIKLINQDKAVRIQGLESDTNRISVYSVSGVKVFETSTRARELTVPLSPGGIYIVKVIQGKGNVFSGKIYIN